MLMRQGILLTHVLLIIMPTELTRMYKLREFLILDLILSFQPCNGKQTQSRTSGVLRMPASYAVSQTCSAQKEDRLCEKWTNCMEYTWELSDWTSCLVNYGSADCGVGHKERYVVCRNINGEVVPPFRCEEVRINSLFHHFCTIM